MQFYKCSLPEISAEKENECEAREIGGLGAKPPAGSRGRAPGNTVVVNAVVLQCGRYPRSAQNVNLVENATHNLCFNLARPLALLTLLLQLGEGGKFTPRPIFLMAFRNRLE